MRHRKHLPRHSWKAEEGGNRRVVGLWGEVKNCVVARFSGGEVGGEIGTEVVEAPEREPVSESVEVEEEDTAWA